MKLNDEKSRKKRIQPIEGTIELVKNLKRSRFKLGVASSSLSQFIKLVLNKLKIKNLFDKITSTQEVKKETASPNILTYR